MTKQMTVKLTKSEINHLLHLVEKNEEDGSYTEPKDQYWKRSQRIKSKLEEEFLDEG